jgi:hypothetical protein
MHAFKPGAHALLHVGRPSLASYLLPAFACIEVAEEVGGKRRVCDALREFPCIWDVDN